MVSRFVMASMGVHVLAAVGVSGMHRVQTKNSPIVVEITRKTVEVKIPDVVPVPPPPVEVPPPQPPPEAEKVAPPAEANPLPALEPAPAPQQVAPAQALAPRPANTRVATAAWRGGGDGAGSGEGGGGAGGGVGTIGTGGTMGVTGAGDTRAFAPGTPGHGVLRDALASLFGVQPGNPAGTGQGSGAAASGGGGGARNAARDPSKTPVAPDAGAAAPTGYEEVQRREPSRRRHHVHRRALWGVRSHVLGQEGLRPGHVHRRRQPPVPAHRSLSPSPGRHRMEERQRRGATTGGSSSSTSWASSVPRGSTGKTTSTRSSRADSPTRCSTSRPSRRPPSRSRSSSVPAPRPSTCRPRGP